MSGFTHKAVMPIRLNGKSHAAGSKVSLSPPEAEDLSRGPYPAVEPIGDTEAPGNAPQGDGEAAGGATTPAPKSKGKK